QGSLAHGRRVHVATVSDSPAAQPGSRHQRDGGFRLNIAAALSPRILARESSERWPIVRSMACAEWGHEPSWCGESFAHSMLPTRSSSSTFMRPTWSIWNVAKQLRRKVVRRPLRDHRTDPEAMRPVSVIDRLEHPRHKTDAALDQAGLHLKRSFARSARSFVS